MAGCDSRQARSSMIKLHDNESLLLYGRRCRADSETDEARNPPLPVADTGGCSANEATSFASDSAAKRLCRIVRAVDHAVVIITTIIKEPIRAVQFLYLRQKLLSRAAIFPCRAPLIARFCPLDAFLSLRSRSHSPRQTPLHGVTNHAKSQDVVENTNIIKTSRKNVHFRKKIQKNLKKLQKRC